MTTAEANITTRIEGGKIAEVWEISDNDELLKQKQA